MILLYIDYLVQMGGTNIQDFHYFVGDFFWIIKPKQFNIDYKLIKNDYQ